MPSLAHGKIPGIEERDKAFYASLQGEDDLGVVVRSHIHIEHELRQFILIAAPAPAEVKFNSDIDYDTTVRLALIVGLSPELKSALKAIGTLRNKFSHRLEMKLGETEIKELYKAMSSTLKQIYRRTYNSMRAAHPERNWPRDPGVLDARDQFMMIAVSIRTGLVAQNLLKRRKASTAGRNQ